MTKILACKCKHQYQDKVYGKNKRVFNEHTNSVENNFECTVCGQTKTVSVKKQQ